MTESTSSMAPKRRRMMDMILVLGGLKEESAIPLSRVSEEITRLSGELEPLTEEIFAFPVSYFEHFLEVAEKSNIVSQIGDKGILREAIARLEGALSLDDSQGVRGILDLLRSALEGIEAA
ncbi:MAG: hypothetical protein ACFFD9_04705, partial [Candidatus Thorarchaeota archaeon]